MAIRWKNNKKKTKLEKTETEPKKTKVWLGYLLVFVLVTAVSVVTYRMEPELQKIREKSQKAKQEELLKQKEETMVDLGYYTDQDKMSLISNIYYLNYKMENMYSGLNAEEYLLKNNKEYKSMTDDEQKKEYEKSAKELVDILYSVYHMDYSVGEGYKTYTYMYDKKRCISSGQEDLADIIEGKDLSNVKENYQSYMVIDFDEKGNPSVTAKYNMEERNFLNYLQNVKLQAVADYFISYLDVIYNVETGQPFQRYVEVVDEYEGETERYEEVDGYENEYEELIEEDIVFSITEIKNTVVNFPKIKDVQVVVAFGYNMEQDSAYYEDHDQAYDLCYIITLCFGILIFVGAVVLQNIPVLGLKKQQIFRMPTEVILIVGFVGLILYSDGELPYIFMFEIKDAIQYWMTDSEFVTEAVMINRLPAAINGGLWLGFYAVIYWGAANVLPYILHPIKNIKENSIIVNIIKYILNQCKRCYTYATTIKADQGLKKNVIKILAANFVVMCLFCCIWFFGIFGMIIYTILLYFLLVKKGGKIKEQYDKLLSMVTDMAQGELNVDVSENLGIFESMKQELTKVRTGFKHAVEEEVKSQNMKTELITNVSHDLKTPLTAIITYVDLLKNENLEEETRKEYIATLDKKSQRLKVLIEDLFEVSKASSNNITMHYADVDLVNLVKQVRLENEERIMDSDLIFRWNLPEEKCVLRLDPQRTYRIIENLLVNALKYSMSGSRVYVEVIDSEANVLFTMKNISATELNFEAEQLTERFVRGDVSRNTEGSGLGLAIARSFTELQNGEFHVEIDGDLFKVTVVFSKQA